ncbi:MAG: hypothetical protein ACO3O0_05425 [Bacteroidia bacterium]
MNIDLEPYRFDLEVIRQTADQVIRDFGIHGIQITFSGNPHLAYQELHQQLVPALKELEKSGPGKIRALLYRIDIPEKDFTQVSEYQNKEIFWDELSALILRRELTKVVTRKLFKSNIG